MTHLVLALGLILAGIGGIIIITELIKTNKRVKKLEEQLNSKNE